jgi:hypothetical protein
MKTMLMSNDSALVVYSGTVEGTYAGRKVPTNVIVTEAWVKQNGTWRDMSYQETSPAKR